MKERIAAFIYLLKIDVRARVIFAASCGFVIGLVVGLVL